MDAHLQDAEPTVTTGDPPAGMTSDAVEQPERRSPASAVCYMNLDEAHPPPAHETAPSEAAESTPTPGEEHDAGSSGPAPRAEESESTPRSEVPSVPDAVNEALLERIPTLDSEPSYFSPQPLRPYSSRIPRSNPSADPSPTNSVNASTTSVDGLYTPPQHTVGHSPTPDRPIYQRDHSTASTTSTASLATVRANSTDANLTFSPPSRERDGPYYPNQSYAALQFQQYPGTNVPHILRTRSSHPAHFPGHSVPYISTFDIPHDPHRDVMESGSRTVGNSPASSPGLFSPNAPPLRYAQQSDDNLQYSTPWLHATHKQQPKETHVADVDVDPVSGRKLVNHYEVIDELGRGVHGKVKLGRNLENNAYVAIKIVDRYSKRRRLGKNTSHEDKIKREIAILKKARHPNIVSLLEVIDDPSKKKVYIVLEHVELGEVKWRTEGAKEVCLVEWRRYQRESEGVFDNESAALEDEKIIRLAHEKLQRQHRRRLRQSRQRWPSTNENELWSLEHGGDSEDDYSENEGSSSTSAHGKDRPSNHLTSAGRQASTTHQDAHMETAFRSSTPTNGIRPPEPDPSTLLEGTMYGAYDTEAIRGRTPSLAGSSSSHFTDGEEEVPEHFRYVPLMTLQAAREAFRDTVLGLEYLHYQNVIHRDIKPANLLVTKEHRIKISDFGVSYLGRSATEDSAESESDVQDADEAIELAKTVGTPAFYAPELCHTEPDLESPPIGPQIDVWALGVTLYCLVYGRVPFHDHNQFRLMKHITDDEPYIPKYRLKPVADTPASRPSSHGRAYHPMTTMRRAPHDLEYEEVDHDLRDLLVRLFVKDPRYRITIKDIKRHPWLTQGIDNYNTWVEETDPDKSSHGQRIEISKDDIDKAVVPFNTLMDRVRFGIRKVGDMARNLTRRDSRRRAQSTASNQDPPPSGSANSSSSTISQEGRRPSLGPGMSIFEALSRSRDPEHPLSQSLTASPEATERQRFFDIQGPRTASPALSAEGREHPAPLPSSRRPHLTDRSISSAGSTRTLRPNDLLPKGRAVSPGIPPALPGTPTALDSPGGGSNLGGIFGGVPRRIIKNARSQEKLLKPPGGHTRAMSIDRLENTDGDAHSGPSLAISTTVASGQVDQPDLLKELSPTIAHGPSPNHFDLQPWHRTERASSRQSSMSSISSRLQQSWLAQNHRLDAGPTFDVGNSMHVPLARDTSDERFSRAKDEFVRRRVREENLERERPLSATYQRPASSLSQTACPPSPDDDIFYQRRQQLEDFLQNQQHASSHDISPVDYSVRVSTQPRTSTSSSSEDQYASMSQSTSHPSIPSVASANSSVMPDDCIKIVPATSGSSIHLNQFDVPTDDPAGYDGDHAVESDDDDSDEEDFLVMGKKKPVPLKSGSISNAELARSDVRTSLKEITSRRRSARSGSNGTVKKIPPPTTDDEEKTPEGP